MKFHHLPLIACLLLSAPLHAAEKYEEIKWELLVPKGWDPARDFKALDLSKLDDADPRAAEALQKLKEMWDQAPTEPALAGKKIRLPGFVIPLDRTKGDLGALKKAIATLKEGKVVGLFPEGTRSPDGQMRAAKGGIGFLIAKGNVPVVPLHISGTFAAFPKGADHFRPSRIVARYGPPISPEEILAAMTKKNDYESVGALVMRRIAELAEPGHDDGDGSVPPRP